MQRLVQSSLLLLATLLFTTLPAVAQLELGVKAGGAFYTGDLSPDGFDILAEDLNFAGGAYLRYRPFQRLGVRVNGNFGRLSAERVVSVRNERRESVEVTREFRSAITEFNILAEFDLFYIGDPEDNFVAPYIFGGIGVLSFNPQARNLDGVYVDLQPLRTEGQGLDPARYAAAPYELTRTVGILGGGIRTRVAGRFIIGLEFGGRLTGTDYLDDIGSTRVNYVDVLRSENGALAAYFSNPGVENPSGVENLEYVRGGDYDDFYFTGGLTVGINIGGGGGRKDGCYTF